MGHMDSSIIVNLFRMSRCGHSHLSNLGSGSHSCIELRLSSMIARSFRWRTMIRMYRVARQSYLEPKRSTTKVSISGQTQIKTIRSTTIHLA